MRVATFRSAFHGDLFPSIPLISMILFTVGVQFAVGLPLHVQQRAAEVRAADSTSVQTTSMEADMAADPGLTASGGVVDSCERDSRGLWMVIGAEAAYYGLSMVVLNNTWYKGRKKVPLHFYDDSRAYLQVDKFGHAFGAYVQSYCGYHLLRQVGISEGNAIAFGGTLGLVMQAPIEIMDGLHEGWGFSWGDMIANASGSALVIGQQLAFGEQIAIGKFSYRESAYARQSNGYLGHNSLDRVLKDYNAHTYWLSIPVARFLPGRGLPPWLCISAGYGADGMYGEYENIREHNGVVIPETPRFRQYLLSLDIDWRRIDTGSPVLDAILTALTFVKLPFPALELTSQGRVKGYALYY